MTARIVTKAEFAEICDTDASRVSHWIRDGKISGKALVGEGRSARIDVEEAQRQLRVRLNAGQRLGNGLGTRLSANAAQNVPPANGANDTTPLDLDEVAGDALDAEIKREKLAQLQRFNRKGAEEEAAAQGRYTETAAARRQMTLVAVQAVRVFEGAIPEVATALAARFGLDGREVALALAELFRDVRAQAADKARAAAGKLDALAPEPAGA